MATQGAENTVISWKIWKTCLQSNEQYVQSQALSILNMRDKLLGTWKEAAVAYFKAVTETDTNYEQPQMQ